MNQVILGVYLGDRSGAPDLYTEVIDWEEMKDLQVAFLKSQIPDQDLGRHISHLGSQI